MKGRSYRFSSTEPHEDWLDGSWTVDCVCGVNFDDGEEMVDCDDCGVWVHTRCSRYVKGEDFTCAKCQSKNNANDSEETEVAQLLVELPTKTLRMENSCTRSVPLKRPFRLWTEIPMEERVHVQGIPGGEPALFEGLSSVFSRELWKCTGYVPKKFNFKYREFPCWDEKEEDKTENTCENGHQEENGAGVLFSMSKKNVTGAHASVLVGTRNLDDKRPNDLKLGAKDTKSSDSGEAEMKHSESNFKKDKSLLRPSITNKRRKELFGATKEAMKKKVEVGGKEEDNKKGCVGKTAFRPTSDSKPSETHKDIDPEGFTNNIGIMKNEKSKKPALEESTDVGPALNNGNDESGNTAIGVECSREQNLSDVHANGAGKQEEKAGHHFRIVLRSSATSDPSVLEEKDVPCTEDNKEERQKTIADTPDDTAVDSPKSLRKPCPGSTEVEEKKCDFVWGNISSRHQKDVADASAGAAVVQQTLDSIDSKLVETSTSQNSGALEFNKMTQGSSRVSDHKLQPVELKQEPVISEGCMLAQKDVLETKTGSGLPQDPPKSCRPVPRNVSGYDRPKVVVCIGKSSSSSATEKSSKSDNPKHSTSRNFIPGSKQQPSDGDANDEDRITPSVSKTRESSNSGTFQKSEKPGQSIFQSSKNPVQSLLSLPPNSSTPLSDEELALRLHHQLNSSPRVPRVPRMRQPGSLPLSPTASSFKRTSSSGSKDHLTFSRRKNKHTSKESFRSSRDDERCVRRTKTRHSPDWRTHESGSRGSVCTKGDDTETLKTSSSSRKVLLPPTSTTSTSSGPCSSNDLNEQNMSSPHSSPRNTSDDTPVHRTLPGLINEIMSKGKRMTYEELCNAVLPHWPHLRKHNGERYAYSSHSQAVLDCLRNRLEWARLVDRGPKTNSGKKKRKVDADESDENGNESSKGRNTSEGRAGKRLHHSQGEEFPKGKRKARKRRRLSLQGKGLKDFRKKRNEDVSDDEEAEAEAEEEGAFSDTSEESVFCEEEEEEEGGGTTTAAGEVEVSASSEEEAEATS